jgi:hypothetical protein
MFRYLVSRLALTIPTFVALMFVTFVAIRLVPGDPVEVDLPLSTAGARVPAGHRLRVAISGAAFPIAWPTPTPVALTLHHDVQRASALRLPTPAGWSEHGPDLGRPVFDPPACEHVAGIATAWRIERDGVAGATALVCESGGGDRFPDRGGVEFASDSRYRLTVADGYSDCRAEGSILYRLTYPDGPAIVAEAGLVLESDRDDLRLRVALAVREDDSPVFERAWELAVPRDLL